MFGSAIQLRRVRCEQVNRFDKVLKSMYSGSVVILPLPLNIFLIIEVVLRNASEDRGMKEFTDSTKPKKKGK